MKRNGAFGKGNDAPKAGALPGCATPRLRSFYITSQTKGSMSAWGFGTDAPAFQQKFRATVPKPIQIESMTYRRRLGEGFLEASVDAAVPNSPIESSHGSRAWPEFGSAPIPFFALARNFRTLAAASVLLQVC
jgi:hypothetical protein